MNAGQIVDEALTLANRSAGRLGMMVMKKKLTRNLLEESASDLEDAARLIRSVLSKSESAA